MGSSSSRIRGSLAMQRAIATRWRSPPDRRSTVRARRRASPHCVMAVSPRVVHGRALRAPRCGCRPIATISSTVNAKSQRVSCGRKATRRAIASRDRSPSAMPSSVTDPSDGGQRPPYTQQRALAAAVGTDDRREHARHNGRRGVKEERAPCASHRCVARLENAVQRPASLSCRSNINRKHGAPHKAVTTPSRTRLKDYARPEAADLVVGAVVLAREITDEPDVRLDQASVRTSCRCDTRAARRDGGAR